MYWHLSPLYIYFCALSSRWDAGCLQGQSQTMPIYQVMHLHAWQDEQMWGCAASSCKRLCIAFACPYMHKNAEACTMHAVLDLLLKLMWGHAYTIDKPCAAWQQKMLPHQPDDNSNLWLHWDAEADHSKSNEGPSKSVESHSIDDKLRQFSINNLGHWLIFILGHLFSYLYCHSWEKSTLIASFVSWSSVFLVWTSLWRYLSCSSLDATSALHDMTCLGGFLQRQACFAEAPNF